MIINDVDVQYFYLGKITDLLLDFDMVVFEEIDESDMDWDTYEPYSENTSEEDFSDLLVASIRTE